MRALQQQSQVLYPSLGTGDAGEGEGQESWSVEASRGRGETKEGCARRRQDSGVRKTAPAIVTSGRYARG